MIYDLIKDNQIIKTRNFDDTPPTLQPEKGMQWLLRVLLEQPVFNQNTQRLEATHTVTATESQHGYTIIDLTQEEIDTKLATLKTQKKQSMKQERQTAIDGTHTVTVPSGTYEIDVDSNSRSNIHQTIDNAELAGLTDTDSTMWKMADNNFYPLTYGELKLIGLQMAQFIQSQYAKEAIKNAEIDSATIDTIGDIAWES